MARAFQSLLPDKLCSIHAADTVRTTDYKVIRGPVEIGFGNPWRTNCAISFCPFSLFNSPNISIGALPLSVSWGK